MGLTRGNLRPDRTGGADRAGIVLLSGVFWRCNSATRRAVPRAWSAFKPIGRLTALIDGSAELVEGELVSGGFHQDRALADDPHAGRRDPASRRCSATAERAVAVISEAFLDAAIRPRVRPPSAGRSSVNQVPVTVVGRQPSRRSPG